MWKHLHPTYHVHSRTQHDTLSRSASQQSSSSSAVPTGRCVSLKLLLMQLASGEARRAQYVASGTQGCVGMLIDARCTQPPASVVDFNVAVDCDAEVAEYNGGQQREVVTAGIMLCEHGQDIGALLASPSTLPGIPEAHANITAIWVRSRAFL